MHATTGSSLTLAPPRRAARAASPPRRPSARRGRERGCRRSGPGRPTSGGWWRSPSIRTSSGQRQRGAAPFEDDQVGPSRPPAGRLEHIRRPRRASQNRPPASIVVTRASADLEVVEAAWPPPARRRARSSSVGGVSATTGSAGPPRPIATTTTSCSSAHSRAAWPETPVFRAPVPTIPIEAARRLEPRRVGGSPADVRDPGGERAARQAQAFAWADDRLVGEVVDEIRPVRGERLVEVVEERRRSPRRRGFSVPPSMTAAATSYGSPASASRTTGA